MTFADNARGVLAIWHDVHVGREADFEFWYKNEHFPERLAVPGFRLGRRFEALAGASRYFCYYLTDTPEVLTSGAYIERLNNPTPLTRSMMTGVFLNMNRTVCRRAERRGAMFGAFAVTLRMQARDRAPDSDLMAVLAAEAGVARCEWWLAADTGQGPAAEEALRGPDSKIGACLVVETMRPADAEAVSDRLRREFRPEADIGIYRLLYELSSTGI